MISNFKSKAAQDIFDGTDSRKSRQVPTELHPKICRLFDQLNAVKDVNELRFPPGNQLEKLKGDLREFWSLRINKQWRIVFRWENAVASDVDITDYH
jgi:proteic killer suppression protein